MLPFLSHVASDIIKKYGNDLSNITVVFPNKRASLFLNQALIEHAQKPIWSPSYITISELFRQYSDLTLADPIIAIVNLYKSFVEITGSKETIDKFYGWGQLLLSDFDDIDKNGADASKVFANVSDWHEFDDVTYLTDEQRKLLQRFFKNFNSEESTLQRNFKQVWSKLYDVYTDYNARLRNQGLAYEGMLYKDALNHDSFDFPSRRYLFVGFNMLHDVEKRLFRLLKQQDKASFYWDYDLHYMDKSSAIPHEAGVYISQYLTLFPNELDSDSAEIYDNLRSKDKQITYISALTEDIQARYISDWLLQNGRKDAGNRTAIVMCNEQLLHTAIHCIPDQIGAINVTTGYPLSLTPVASFVLQQAAKHRDDRKNTTTNSDFLHSLCKDITTTPELLNKEDAFSQEALFKTYTLLHRLSDIIDSGELEIRKDTLFRFISQMISSTSIPFHGEPAIGIQLMGVLETRNLDFDHLLILSCNEGNMPKSVNDSSFIPHAIRKAYGLTTIEHKVAIYSYYFHRLLQRCNDITILYNKSTEGTSTGEMSQFMLQLLAELPITVSRKTLQAGQSVPYKTITSIPKNDEVATRLSSYLMDYRQGNTSSSKDIRTLSPTAINTYLRCPLRFYYKYVANIHEPDEQEDGTIDNRLFGTIFHRAAQLMYEELLPKDMIKKGDIDHLIHDKSQLTGVVNQAIKENIQNNDAEEWEKNGLNLINKEVITTYLLHLLALDQPLTPFKVLCHEYNIKATIPLGNYKLQLGGFIDRIDVITNSNGETCLRVIDYKTGRIPHNTVKTVDDIFDSKNLSDKHSDYTLQAMLYSILLAQKQDICKGHHVIPALLFIQHTQREGYNPIITLNKRPISDVLTEYGSDFMEKLSNLLSEIFDPTIPFSPTPHKKHCSSCPYRRMCR